MPNMLPPILEQLKQLPKSLLTKVQPVYDSWKLSIYFKMLDPKICWTQHKVSIAFEMFAFYERGLL